MKKKNLLLAAACLALAGVLAGCAGTAASSDAAAAPSGSEAYSSVQPAEIEVKPSPEGTVAVPLPLTAEELVGSWSYVWTEHDSERDVDWEYISAVTFYDNGEFEYVIGMNYSDMADFVNGTYEYAPENGLKLHFKEFLDGIEETNSLLSETFVYTVEQSGGGLQFSCDAKDQHTWNDIPFLTMAEHVRDDER